jgi:hypothetical protein
MKFFIYFRLNLFLGLIPNAHVFKYEKSKAKHVVYILFKMRMKAKTYEINF